MIIYRVSGNPVKSRVSGLFPKKCPIHNSAIEIIDLDIIPDSSQSGKIKIWEMSSMLIRSTIIITRFTLHLLNTFEPGQLYTIGYLNNYRPIHHTGLNIVSAQENAWYDVILFSSIFGGKITFATNTKCWDITTSVNGIWLIK